MSTATQGPLAGLKVLDFSTLLPGPFATLMLADLGAEVIHIESPTRVDLVRITPPYADGQTTAHAYLNRNKKSVALDLKQPQSRQRIHDWLSDYDIVVEQFRPGVMQRLGLDYETLRAINPRLIYCSITGYGQTGSLRDRAGHDINYLALSGVAGHSGRLQGGPPPLGIQVADVAGGSLHAVIGLLAAVIERQRSGLGQHIDISMTDCAFSLNSMAAAAEMAGGQPQQPEGGALNGGSFYDYYQTRDGRWLAIGGLEPQFLQGLAQLLKLPILLEKGLSLNPQDQQEVREALGEVMATEDWLHWREVFAALDLCVEPVLTLGEAARSVLAVERGWLVPVPVEASNASGAMQQQLAHPIKFSRSRPQYRHMGRALGADNETI